MGQWIFTDSTDPTDRGGELMRAGWFMFYSDSGVLDGGVNLFLTMLQFVTCAP
jgi:hypothetical protein